ncbi:MAG: acyl-CoA dehydrogenase [Cohaesibacter sp.]|jgi:alkylation response protein AidB-like acyl-CoA dehydrogenase|nr:acyl-CoA dehydrogenase [Cohaesibacter sp.]
MNFEFDETEQMLADSVTRFMQDTAGLEQARADAALKEGFSPKAWQTCAEMGWLAAPFGEEVGGFGMGAVGSMIVAEAMGAGLSPLPYLPAAIFAGRVLEGVGERGAALLESQIAGESLTVMALHEEGRGYNFTAPSTKAIKDGEGWCLEGRKSQVLNAAAADGFIVTAIVEEGVDGKEEFAIFHVPADAEGLSQRIIQLMDNRQAAHLELSGVKLGAESRLDDGSNGLALFETAYQEALIAAASEMLGAMQAAFDMTLDYAKTRKQFGQPLGKFQVLQHRLVDMSIKVEEARSLVMAAAMALRDGLDEAESMVSAAWVQAIWSGRKVGEESIQLHGGIGMTDELAIGDYVKRIAVNELLFGIPMVHIGRYNQQTGS